MCSRRKRTSDRSICPQEIIDAARKRIADGESKRSVAKDLGMAESTLRLRLNRAHSATNLGRYDTTFSKEVEVEFCKYLTKLDDMFYGMTAKDLRVLAFQYAEKNNIPHRFNPESNMAGKEWLRGFMKRHPDILLRKPTSTSVARAMGFNLPQCERFFINLSATMDRYNFSPNDIYNMDETGISSVPNNPPRVISTKGKRAVNKIASGERGTNVTVVSAMSATGHFIPPAFIFGRKRMKAELLDGSPPGSIGMVSDSSFINSELFLVWLSHFKDHAKPTKEKPVLLILDNHSSHITIGAVDYYRDNYIIALTLPPHSSHKLQPLDRGFHVALKRYYSSECEKWLRNNPGRTITVFQMCNIFTPAFFKAATPACAAESFKTTGISPFNPDVFSDVDFLASSVTERENEADIPEANETFRTQDLAQETPNMAQHDIEMINLELQNETSPRDMPQKQAVPPLISEKTTGEDSVTEAIEKIQNEKAKSPPKTRVATCSQQELVKISDLSPLPKSQVKRSFTRKHKRSEIISSSPYKNELTQKKEEKAKPAVKKIKIDEAGPSGITTRGKNTESRVLIAKNIKVKPTNHAKPEPKSTKSIVKRNKSKINSKKTWTCPGCGEIYKEPIIEDWIICVTCNEWWHEQCTAHTGAGDFICDLCQ